MKILIVGAGAIGGYFGGRLLEKGEDVTFLVRDRRKEELETTGLKIESANGDCILNPKLITKNSEPEAYDVVLLSTKSYQLAGAIEDVRSFVGDETMVLPLLNGISHIDQLVEAFGEQSVIGGLCFVEATLGENGTIVQTSPLNQLVYGERSGEQSDRIERLKQSFESTKAEFILSDNINQEMWHKYLFITTMSGITTLFEEPIGPIRELESGQRTITALLNELEEVMKKFGAPIEHGISNKLLEKINSLGEGMKSSMQRDAEKSQPIEADHLQGYLLERAKDLEVAVPVLETVYTKLKLYEKGVNN
ncbi:ketopantoate reductase family protein [Planococcus halotolerans]|uniref:2-dehydropantoate 2-reductase n=1 Tax=Planococcus halotolerans TaxID=2233542 RepID=A0A365KQH4_9BACL|nr:ketopantoate reductase family protein [Planococcus halotolerans]QHJ69428.1 2-dehydropantoate 2-reductase [Planococcus halotolerans]RAZ75379.1 oxidoreductase [Planococcus halotolerans]